MSEDNEKTIDAVMITALGNIANVRINGLRDMQRAVGGMVEAIDVGIGGKECTIWLNEEGKIWSLPSNTLATDLAEGRIFAGDYIAGDVLITGGVDDEGETLGVHPDVAGSLMYEKDRRG